MENENKIVEENVQQTIEVTESKEEDNSPSLEEQLQALRVENAKLRKATDKATSEASSYKKQLREKQTVDEIAMQEKAEKEAARQEAYEQLLRENKINKLEKKFVVLGYTEEQANKAATATYDGDTDTLFRIQTEFNDALVKAKEAEWLKSRPQVQSGVGSSEQEDPFLKGFLGK